MITMTMLELYKSAWNEISRKYAHEEEINNNTLLEFGRENRIAKSHMKEYTAQMQELTNLIIEAE